MAGALAFVVYGSVALVSILAYERFGINYMDYESPAEAWDTLVPMLLTISGFMAVIGPVAWRLHRR